MKKLWFLSIFLLPLFACPLDFFNDDDLTGEAFFKAQVDTIIIVQENILDAMEQSFLVMDSTSAIAKVVQDYQNDPSIRSIEITNEGIGLEYKNGMIGVITLFYGLNEDGFDLDTEIEVRNTFNVPASKNALYLISEYEYVGHEGEHVAVAAKAQLTKPGFSFEIARGPQFNLDKLKNLEGYGIIHFYSHGIIRKNNTLAYLGTGEKFDKFNYTSILANQDAFKNGEIGFNTTLENGNKVHRFFVLPEFIINNNDFSIDSTMIFGQFCYSSLGKWRDLVFDANAMNYMGFNWKIGKNTSKSWMTNMYVSLCDTMKEEPEKLYDWLIATPRSYVSSDPKNPVDNGYTLIHLWGDQNSTFWKPKLKNEILRIDVDLYLEDAQFKFIVDGNESQGGGAHRVFVSSREGTSSHIGKTYKTTFNKTIFFTEYSGSMTIKLNNNSVDVNLTQVRKSGGCTSTYTIDKYNVPYSANEGAYYQSGTAAQSGLTTSYYQQCTNTSNQLISYNINANDYFKVDVVYR